jgi:hypothetical protein
VRNLSAWLVPLLACAVEAYGQAAPAAPPAADSDAAARAWSLSASVFTYFLPDERDYVQPTFTADSEWLHLEVRYNYEDLETASVWMGYNLSGGSTIEWELTPMLGGVYGSTNGIAPGLRGSLAWWKIDFYAEAEYVFDAGSSDDSYFYNWSELALVPADWLRVGMVTQRTRVYEMGRYIQRGPFVGVAYRSLEATAYLLDADRGKPIVVVAATVEW